MVDYIESSKRWAYEFVVVKNLCPFAKKPLEDEGVHWLVCNDVKEIDEIIEQFFKSDFSSTFIILPFLNDFESYLDVADFVEHISEVMGYKEDLTLVLFHPKNQYEGMASEAEVNFANRAPYPCIQLLRNNELEALEMTDEWKGQILDRNAETLTEIGSKKLREIFDGFTK